MGSVADRLRRVTPDLSKLSRSNSRLDEGFPCIGIFCTTFQNMSFTPPQPAIWTSIFPSTFRPPNSKSQNATFLQEKPKIETPKWISANRCRVLDFWKLALIRAWTSLKTLQGGEKTLQIDSQTASSSAHNIPRLLCCAKCCRLVLPRTSFLLSSPPPSYLFFFLLFPSQFFLFSKVIPFSLGVHGLVRLSGFRSVTILHYS